MVARGGWVGSNVSKVRIVNNGYQRVSSDLKGGLPAAKSLFKALTGKAPVEKQAIQIPGKKINVVFRGDSKSGTPAVEIINETLKTYEKIHFNP